MIKTVSITSLSQLCVSAVLAVVIAMGVAFMVPQKAAAQISVPDTSQMSEVEIEFLILQLRVLIMQLLADMGGSGGGVSDEFDLDDNSADVLVGDQKEIGEFWLNDRSEERYFNELTVHFDSFYGPHPADVIDSLVLEIELEDAVAEYTFEYSLDSRSDWEEVSDGVYALTLFDRDDVGFGLYIPAGEEVYGEIEIEILPDAEESDWGVGIETLALYSPSQGDYTIGNAESITFEVIAAGTDTLGQQYGCHVDNLCVASVLDEYFYDVDVLEVREGVSGEGEDAVAEFVFVFDVTAEDHDLYIERGSFLAKGSVGEKADYMDVARETVDESSTADITRVSGTDYYVVEAFETEEFTVTLVYEPVVASRYLGTLYGFDFKFNGEGPLYTIDLYPDRITTDFVAVSGITYAEWLDQTDGSDGPDGGGQDTPAGPAGDGGQGEGYGEGEGAGAGPGDTNIPFDNNPFGPSNTADDRERKQDLDEIADGLHNHFAENQTFRIDGGGYMMSDGRQAGNGWFNYECDGPAEVCRYPKSVANVLLENSHLDRYIVDPSGSTVASNEQSGYMMLISDLPSGRVGEHHFTLWANLEEPTAADLDTLDDCHFSNYDNFPSNRDAAVQMNYCVDGSRTISPDGSVQGASISLDALISELVGRAAAMVRTQR